MTSGSVLQPAGSMASELVLWKQRDGWTSFIKINSVHLFLLMSVKEMPHQATMAKNFSHKSHDKDGVTLLL